MTKWKNRTTISLVVAIVLLTAANATASTVVPDNDELASGATHALQGLEPAFSGGPLFYVQTRGTTEWNHSVGTQTITSQGVVLSRRVELWSATDGRYRVKVTSLDGSGESEEVAYDGRGHQLVFITDTGGLHREAFVINNRTHFAVTGPAKISGSVGSMSYSVTGSTRHVGDPSALMIDIPEGLTVYGEDRLSRAATGSSGMTQPSRKTNVASGGTTGSNMETFVDLYGRPCLEARNYRNSVTNYFRASSRIVSNKSLPGACLRLQLSIWKNGWPNGWCGIAHHRTVGIAYVYINWTGFFEVVGKPGVDDVACSRHWAWDEDWVLQTPLGHLPATVRG